MRWVPLALALGALAACAIVFGDGTARVDMDVNIETELNREKDKK
jgi:hypothetical protein